MVPFGSWRPDVYGLNSGFSGEASAVLPGASSYQPWPQMAISSPAAATVIRGAFAARTTVNATAIFALSATKAYKFAGVATAWTDVTRAVGGDYALATDDMWAMLQFGVNVYGFNITDDPQFIHATSGTAFALLTGSPPKARFAKVVGDFIMVGNTADDPREVRWCGRNDPTAWTKGRKDADAQPLPDGGDVMGILGLERGGLVFQTEAVRQFTASPGREVFRFWKLETAQGTRAPYSIVSHKGTAYYYGLNGFQAISVDGTSLHVGSNWVDEWFAENSNAANRPKAICGAVDPKRLRIFWLFATAGNPTSTTFDHVLCYDPGLIESNYGPWTHAAVSGTVIFPAATTATTLENLGSAGLGYTLETVPYSLDSDVWKGGAPALAIFDSANKLNYFTGTPMASTVQTAQFQPVPPRRFYINGFRPITDATNASGRVSTTERPQTVETWGASNTINNQGIIPLRASGRFLRAEVTVAAGQSWDHLQGIDLDGDNLLVDGGEI